MYKKDFVAVIKCNGKILREIDDVVTIPFGSEYSILLKNLNSRKAQISITIDGKDVLDGKNLVVDGNKETELKGYMRGFSAKNRFKFIQKTKEISEHRGDFIDDGIVRIEYQFEKKIVTQRVRTEYCNHTYRDPIIVYNGTNQDHFSDEIHIYTNQCDRGMSIEKGVNGDVSLDSDISGTMSLGFGPRGISGDSPRLKRCSINHDMSHKSKGFKGFLDGGIMDPPTSQPLEDEGITVKGSQCNQQFREVWMGELEEQSSVITLKLRGYTEKCGFVSKPITVKTKIECDTCGKLSKSNAKFCSRCGTSLI